MRTKTKEKQEDYARRLKEDQTFAGLTVADHADHYGVTPPTILRWRENIVRQEDVFSGTDEEVARAALLDRIKKHGDPQAVKIFNDYYKGTDTNANKYKGFTNDQVMAEAFRAYLGKQAGHGEAKLLKILELVKGGQEIPAYVKVDAGGA